MRIYLVVIVMICGMFLFGCPKPFQPPPDAYNQWKRHKTTDEEVKKIMLRCGYPNPFGEGRDALENDIALMHLCMEKNNFEYRVRFGRYCSRHPNLPACVAAAEEKAAIQGAIKA